MAGLSDVLLKSAVAAVLKADKFDVTRAAIADNGEGIAFDAKSKSGQVRITGLFSDPQGQLELTEPEPEASAADDGANDDEEEASA